eukprot:777060-Amphidinium_carterae.1
MPPCSLSSINAHRLFGSVRLAFSQRQRVADAEAMAGVAAMMRQRQGRCSKMCTGGTGSAGHKSLKGEELSGQAVALLGRGDNQGSVAKSRTVTYYRWCGSCWAQECCIPTAVLQ